MMPEAGLDHVDRRPEVQAEPPDSLASLFLHASRRMALSDARIFRSIDQHLKATRDVLSRAAADAPEAVPVGQLSAGHEGPPSYARQTRQSLESLCRAHAVRGFSRMNKPQMIAALKALGVPPPPVPLQALSKSELIALIEDILSPR